MAQLRAPDEAAHEVIDRDGFNQDQDTTAVSGDPIRKPRVAHTTHNTLDNFTWIDTIDDDDDDDMLMMIIIRVISLGAES